MSEVGVLRALEAGSRRAQFFECLPVACYACDCTGAITDYNRRAVENELKGMPSRLSAFSITQRIERSSSTIQTGFMTGVEGS